nr:hypothetical protein [Streptomyces sp. ISL-94]
MIDTRVADLRFVLDALELDRVGVYGHSAGGTAAAQTLHGDRRIAAAVNLEACPQRYRPGYREWTRIRRRDTTEAVIGAITGTRVRPRLLLLGRLDTDGRLRAVGRTVSLRP